MLPQTEAASALDTEAQMAQAKLSAQEEMDADAELLGVKRKKTAAASAAAGAGAAGTGAAGTDAGDAAGTSGEAGAEGMDVDEEKVCVDINMGCSLPSTKCVDRHWVAECTAPCR